MSQNPITDWHERQLKQGFDTRIIKNLPHVPMQLTATFTGETERIAIIRNDRVFVIPVIVTEETTYTILLERYRTGTGSLVRMFPGVGVQDGEELIDAAGRAFPGKVDVDPVWIQGFGLIELGEQNFLSPGTTNEQVWYVACEMRLPRDVDITSLNIAQDNREGGKMSQTIFALDSGLHDELHVVGDKLALTKLLSTTGFQPVSSEVHGQDARATNKHAPS